MATKEGTNSPYRPVFEGEVSVYQSPFARNVLLADEARLNQYGKLEWWALDPESDSSIAAIAAYQNAQAAISPSPMIARRTVLGWATTLAARYAKQFDAHEAQSIAVGDASRFASCKVDKAIELAQNQGLYPKIDNAAEIERMLAQAIRYKRDSAKHVLSDMKASINCSGGMFTFQEHRKALMTQFPELQEPAPFLVATPTLNPDEGPFQHFETFAEAAKFVHDDQHENELHLFNGNQRLAISYPRSVLGTDEAPTIKALMAPKGMTFTSPALEREYDQAINAYNDLCESDTMYTVSVTFDKWDSESIETGEALEVGTHTEEEQMDTDEVVRLVRKLGIHETNPVRTGKGLEFSASSVTPDENSEYFQSGISTFYTLHLHAVDGQPLTPDSVTDFCSQTGLEVDAARLAPPAPKPMRLG